MIKPVARNCIGSLAFMSNEPIKYCMQQEIKVTLTVASNFSYESEWQTLTRLSIVSSSITCNNEWYLTESINQTTESHRGVIPPTEMEIVEY